MSLPFLPKKIRRFAALLMFTVALVGGVLGTGFRVIDLVEAHAASAADQRLDKRLGEFNNRLIRIEAIMGELHQQRCSSPNYFQK